MMNKIANGLKRKFRKVSRTKNRASRSPKLRLFEQNIEEDIAGSAGTAVTPHASAEEAEQHSEANEEWQDVNSPMSPEKEMQGAVDVQLLEELETEVQNSGSKKADIGKETLDQSVPDGDLQQVLSEDGAYDALIDEDAVRETFYVSFSEAGDDEGDYTGGPPRMILANDGLKDCVALLMTVPLSNKIKDSIRAEQDCSRAKRKALDEEGLYTRFGHELETEISNHKDRLSGEEQIDEVQQRRLKEELSNLELMLEANKADLQRIQSNAEFRADMLRQYQEELNAELEPALIRAALLNSEESPIDEPLEELDLQREYQRFVEEQRGSQPRTPVTVTPLDTSQDHILAIQEPLDPEMQRQEDLKEAAWNAFWRHHAALEAFERRQEDRLEDQRANYLAATSGDLHANQEEFDLRWFQKIQELTRELIEAESALSAAKAAAAEEGVDVHIDDHASGLLDDVADGYRMSQEQAMIDSAQAQPKIDEWMSGIPEVASPSFNEREEEADEWEAADVQISDSVSMVAEDAGDRKRIDKWRKVCGLE